MPTATKRLLVTDLVIEANRRGVRIDQRLFSAALAEVRAGGADIVRVVDDHIRTDVEVA